MGVLDLGLWELGKPLSYCKGINMLQLKKCLAIETESFKALLKENVVTMIKLKRTFLGRGRNLSGSAVRMIV